MNLRNIFTLLLVGLFLSQVAETTLNGIPYNSLTSFQQKIERADFASSTDQDQSSDEKSSVEKNNDIIVPTLIKSKNNDEAYAGLISTEVNQTSNPNELTELRKSFLSQVKNSYDPVSVRRFSTETFTFFVAVGAVTYNSMWIKSHGDPLAMERHIMSLKDPVAHISFYAFMQSQGVFINFHTSKAKFAAMDATTRQQMLVKLSYSGMAVGSLASSVVADLGQTITQCVDQWFKGKTDEASLQSCNQAWNQWTARKKMTQYFPQIITMWASQAATEFIEKNAVKTFNKISLKKMGGSALKENFLKMAHKIKSVDVVMMCIPGEGWTAKGIKFLGSATRIALFISADQIITKYANRPLNNIVIPFMSYYDFKDFNSLWQQADLANWDPAKIRYINNNHAAEFQKEINNYTENMQAWRNHLNEDAELDLMGWNDMTKKVLNQIDYSYKFYREFSDSYFESMSIKNQVSLGQLDATALNQISGYPFRTLPFYGVKPGLYKTADGSSLNDYYLLNPRALEIKQKEHLLNTAKNFQQKKYKFSQLEENKIYQKIISNLLSQKNNLMAEGLLLLNESLSDYELGIKEIGIAAAGKVGIATGNYSLGLIGYVAEKKAKYDMNKYSKEFTHVLVKLKSNIGNPQPIIYPFAGFSQAVAANSIYKSSGVSADYSTWSIKEKYKFNKSSDLMMYQIICADQMARLNRYVINKNYKVLNASWLQPEFIPPTLLNKDPDREQFCNSISTSTNLYNSLISDQSLQKYFIANFNTNLFGSADAKINQAAFEKWWIKNVKIPMNIEFKNMDAKYKIVFKEAFDNFKGNRSLYDKATDIGNHHKFYYPLSLEKSLKAESNVYLQLINRAFTENRAADKAARSFIEEEKNKRFSVSDSFIEYGKNLLNFTTDALSRVVNIYHVGTDAKTDFILKATENSNQKAFESVYSHKVKKEIANLYLALNDYYKFVGADDDQFENYIIQSKKIDTAINEILVRAGLKTHVKIISTEDNFDLSGAMSGTENSQLQYADVKIENLGSQQRIIISAVQGIRQVESEIRRFIRMGMTLKNSLALDNKEMSDALIQNMKLNELPKIKVQRSQSVLGQ